MSMIASISTRPQPQLLSRAAESREVAGAPDHDGDADDRANAARQPAAPSPTSGRLVNKLV